MNRCPHIPREEWLDQDGGVIMPQYGNLEELGCCPGGYARASAAVAAYQAWKWWTQGQLELLYPGGVPAQVIAAVDLAQATHSAWMAEGARQRAPKGR